MKYHVITPFSRFENFAALRDMLRDQRTSEQDIHWHLILDDNPSVSLQTSDDWIHQNRFPTVRPVWEMWRLMITCMAHSPEVSDTDRYMILHDDDFYEPGFFKKIDAVAGNIVICSMKRGNAIPPGLEPHLQHPPVDLIARPESMAVCAVGAQQIVMSGSIFRVVNLPSEVYADGLMIVDLVKRFGASYAPDAFVWFNYLQPGRWIK